MVDLRGVLMTVRGEYRWPSAGRFSGRRQYHRSSSTRPPPTHQCAANRRRSHWTGGLRDCVIKPKVPDTSSQSHDACVRNQLLVQCKQFVNRLFEPLRWCSDRKECHATTNTRRIPTIRSARSTSVLTS
jgi:hypothetical protein